jgi:hypothetical protein
MCISEQSKAGAETKTDKKREELSNNGLEKFIEMQKGTEERRAEQKRSEQKGFLI